jgi:HEAT repeat protein
LARRRPSLKENVAALLQVGEVEALKAMALDGQRITSTLLSLLFTEDEGLRWKVVAALGDVSQELGRKDIDRVRDLIQRLLWSLNDESGSIGWHAPEALGEVISRNTKLIFAFGPVVASQLDIERNFWPGLLWAIGRIARERPEPLAFIMPRVIELLSDPEPRVRGMAAWALGQAGYSEAAEPLKGLVGDGGGCEVFEEGRLRGTSVGELASEALGRLSGTRGVEGG